MTKRSKHSPSLSEQKAGGFEEGDSPIASVVVRNIATLKERRRTQEAKIGWQERLADAITRFTGSMAFVYLHLLWFGSWIAINSGLVPWIQPWDPRFVILGIATSIEAIFLATFILIRENRMADAAGKHADLDLHMSLLTEHEVTKIGVMVTAIAEHLGLDPDVGREELDELKQDVAPEKVLDKIENSTR
jgi:uncharacterized membrane protein